MKPHFEIEYGYSSTDQKSRGYPDIYTITQVINDPSVVNPKLLDLYKPIDYCYTRDRDQWYDLYGEYTRLSDPYLKHFGSGSYWSAPITPDGDISKYCDIMLKLNKDYDLNINLIYLDGSTKTLNHAKVKSQIP